MSDSKGHRLMVAYLCWFIASALQADRTFNPQIRYVLTIRLSFSSGENLVMRE